MAASSSSLTRSSPTQTIRSSARGSPTLAVRSSARSSPTQSIKSSASRNSPTESLKSSEPYSNAAAVSTETSKSLLSIPEGKERVPCSDSSYPSSKKSNASNHSLLPGGRETIDTRSLTKGMISAPNFDLLNQNQSTIESKVSKKSNKILKEDISAPIFVTKNTLSNDNKDNNEHLQCLSSFKPSSYARVNSDYRNNNFATTVPSSNNNYIESKSVTSGMKSSTNDRLSNIGNFNKNNSKNASRDSLHRITENWNNASSYNRRYGVKAKSFDGLISDHSSTFSLNSCQDRAFSADKLDNKRRSTVDHVMLYNQLCHRNRSNSVDFKTLTGKDSIYDPRLETFDKRSRGILSPADKFNKRRSLVLEEIAPLKHYTPMQRLDDVESAVVLDVDTPPKLPPKQRKKTDQPPKLLPNVKHSYENDISVLNGRNSEHLKNNLSPQNDLPPKIQTSVAKPERQPPPVLPRKLYLPPSASATSSPAIVEKMVEVCEENEKKGDSFKDRSGNSTRKGSIRNFFSSKQSTDKDIKDKEFDSRANKLPKVR